MLTVQNLEEGGEYQQLQTLVAFSDLLQEERKIHALFWEELHVLLTGFMKNIASINIFIMVH